MPATAQAIPIRPIATIPDPIIRAVPATLVMAEEAVTAGAEAIDAACRADHGAELCPAAAGILDSFQSLPGISLESLEKAFFPFASCCGLTYPRA
jgi:hypothetical protein